MRREGAQGQDTRCAGEAGGTPLAATEVADGVEYLSWLKRKTSLFAAKSASHHPASVGPTPAGWKTGGTPHPVCITVLLGVLRTPHTTRRRLAPPLPVRKPAVRPTPAGWKTGGTPRPCRLENWRYAPPLPVGKLAGRPAHACIAVL